MLIEQVSNSLYARKKSVIHHQSKLLVTLNITKRFIDLNIYFMGPHKL